MRKPPWPFVGRGTAALPRAHSSLSKWPSQGPVESPRLCYDRIVSIFRLKNNSYKGDFRSCLMILPNLRYLHPTSEDHCSGQVPGGQGPFFSIFFVLIQSEGLSSNNNEQPNTVPSALPFSLNPHKKPMR